MPAVAPEIKAIARQKIDKIDAKRKVDQIDYSRDVVKWAEDNFYVEETVDREAGLIHLMPHQKVVLRYAFKKVNGLFPFQTMIYSSVKKSGKTAISSLVARWATETWGKSNDVYFVGNDAEQSKERGYAALRTSIEMHDNYNRRKQELPNQWRLRDTVAKHIPTGSRVHAIATDYKGEAGSNPVLSVWTELWGFIHKDAKRFWAEMAPSPTRPYSIRFIETYAGFMGESELLEDLYMNVVTEANQLTVQDLMDTLGPDYEPGCFEEAINPTDPVPMYANFDAGIFAYWDSGEKARRMPWQRGEHGAKYYANEAATQTESQFRRLHLDEWVSAESEFIPIEWWDSCCNPLPLRLRTGEPDKSLPLVVSLDAAVSGDCFGLVVVSRDPDSPEDKVAIRSCRAWTPPAHGKINFDDVAEVLRWLKEHFDVVCVTYDPYQLEYFAKKFREELELWFEPFDQGQRRLKADKQFYDLIAHKMIRHDGNPDMRSHIQNCNAKIPKEDDSKIRLVKKSDSLKIDLAVAASMGCAECLRLSI